jgi:predicted DNA-binding ribbon-helix-helix protein
MTQLTIDTNRRGLIRSGTYCFESRFKERGEMIGAVMSKAILATFKRSLKIGQLRTSISLEEEFWECLKEIASLRETPVTVLVAQINERRQGNLSSAVRLFVLDHYQNDRGMG